MKFTLSWLKEHLETDATLDEICERLTAIGLEVEDVDDKAAYKPFVIAKVISADKRFFRIDRYLTSDINRRCGRMTNHHLRKRLPPIRQFVGIKVLFRHNRSYLRI